MGETRQRRLNFKAAWRRVRTDESVRAAVFAFVLTRLIIFAILIVGGQINRVAVGSGETERHVRLSLEKVPVSRILRETVHVADVRWYGRIAEHGYEKRPFDAVTQHNWAFFPLFPLLWRAASRLTGEMILTGMLLSNLFFFFALLLLHKLAINFGLDSATADRVLFYLCVFPTSHFFSLPLTESLFLLLTVGSFYAARQKLWWAAGALGALASATRVTGVLLLPALLLLYLNFYGREWRRASLLWLFLIPTGLLSFMYYLYVITGNPFAFKDALAAWGRGTGLFVIPLLQYLRDPLMIAIPWDFRLVNFIAATAALVCGLILLKRREWALALYSLSSVVVALSSLLLQSQARYAMVVFPVFFVLAEAGARPRVDQTIRAVSLALLCLMTALFAAHFTMAMA